MVYKPSNIGFRASGCYFRVIAVARILLVINTIITTILTYPDAVGEARMLEPYKEGPQTRRKAREYHILTPFCGKVGICYHRDAR